MKGNHEHRDPAERNESIQKLRSMMKGIRVAMLTTAMEDGTLRSRPMATQEVEFDGDVWFFTGKSTPKMDEIKANTEVNVAYANPGDSVFVSLSGSTEVVTNRDVMRQFWNPAVEAWFPKGIEDPDLVMLKVHVEQAEYWDSPGGRMVQMMGFFRSLATGEPPDMGENKKLKEVNGELRTERRSRRGTRRKTASTRTKHTKSRR